MLMRVFGKELPGRNRNVVCVLTSFSVVVDKDVVSSVCPSFTMIYLF